MISKQDRYLGIFVFLMPGSLAENQKEKFREMDRYGEIFHL